MQVKKRICTGGKIHLAYTKNGGSIQVEKSTSLYKVYHTFMGFLVFSGVPNFQRETGRKEGNAQREHRKRLKKVQFGCIKSI